MKDELHAARPARVRPRWRPRPGALPGHGRLALIDLVDRLDARAEGRERVSLGELAEETGPGGLAPLLMVVALLMILPLGMIPGVGGALGILAALIGMQMFIGRDHLSLPGFVANRSLPAARMRQLLARARPYAVRTNRVLKARFEPLAASRPALMLIALALILSGLSLTIVGVIPVATPLLGLPIAIFSAGILCRDGAVVAGGWVALGLAVALIILAGQSFMG